METPEVRTSDTLAPTLFRDNHCKADLGTPISPHAKPEQGCLQEHRLRAWERQGRQLISALVRVPTCRRKRVKQKTTGPQIQSWP